MSRDGGFLHRSVFGGAARLNDPIYSGSAASLGQFKAVKQELSGGMVLYTGKRARGSRAVLEDAPVLQRGRSLRDVCDHSQGICTAYSPGSVCAVPARDTEWWWCLVCTTYQVRRSFASLVECRSGKDRACKLLTRAANLHSTRSGKKIVEGRLRLIEPNLRQICRCCNAHVSPATPPSWCQLGQLYAEIHGARSGGLLDDLIGVV